MKHRYEVGFITLDVLELNFREAFGLSPYSGQHQNFLLKWQRPDGISEPIRVTEEFYERLLLLAGIGSLQFENGYIVYLKKPKVYVLEPQEKIRDAMLELELTAAAQFIEQLEFSLRLIKTGTVQISHLFASLPDEKRLIPAGRLPNAMPPGKGSYHFDEKDNYSLAIWMSIENKISPCIQLGMESFLEALKMGNTRLRFLQFFFSLEICFSSFPDWRSAIIPQGAASLLTKDRQQLSELSHEMKALCDIRDALLRSGSPGDTVNTPEEGELRKKADRLEELTREIITKLVRKKGVAAQALRLTAAQR